MPPANPGRSGKTDENVYRQVGRVMGLSFLLPVCVLVGYLIGRLLDRVFGTGFLSFVFMGLGLAAGIMELVRAAAKDAGMDSSGGPRRGN
jgi:F0F1-type ATP synthase assembly protein I